MKFRYDLNALRAIAVSGVILYHFKIAFFKGGFCGVDVFFVISGYLMSYIIMNGMDKNKFSFKDFYIKRVKRIIPALLSVVFIVMVMCFFLYFPNDYRLVVRNAAATLLFLSNVLYWKKSGYFDPVSDTNIFLHTWSLSVEWQFYLIYPVIILVLNKFIKNRVKLTLFFIGLTVVVAILSVIFTKFDSTASFYLLPSRSWEMMLGGVAFLISDYVKGYLNNKTTAIISYGIIFCCLLFLNNVMDWPGLFTYIPAVATMFVIIANQNDFGLIKNPVVQFVGKISYSLYLWHWPVYVISRYLAVEVTYATSIALIGLSVILAYLSFKYVEAAQFRSVKPILATLIILALCNAGMFAHNFNHVLFKPNSLYVADYPINHTDQIHEQFYSGGCFIDGSKSPITDYNKQNCLKLVEGKKNILLIGDSHGADIAQSLREALARQNINLIQITSSGCMPVLAADGVAPVCKELMTYIYKDFIPTNFSKIDGVIISSYWALRSGDAANPFANELKATLDYLKGYKISAILIGQNETYTNYYPQVAAKQYQDGKILSQYYINPNSLEMDEFMSKNFKQYYINIYNKKSIPLLSSANDPYMFDADHYTKYGSDLATKKIFADPIFIRFLTSSKNNSR